MKKIPTLFVRDFGSLHLAKPYLTGKVTPGCEWVLEGTHPATRKYDGTCVLISDEHAPFTRREVRLGKTPPPHFIEVESDPVTGKLVGWEPAFQSGFFRVIDAILRATPGSWPPGTYELVGPKINGNPEHREEHALIRHADAEILSVDTRSFKTLDIDLQAYRREGIEGVVWHHNDGRMAKLKGKDFR